MTEIVKYLGDTLRRYYGTVVERPMPWSIIDKLVTLEEKAEHPSSPQSADVSSVPSDKASRTNPTSHRPDA